MDETTEFQQPDRVALTVDIVRAYVTRNTLRASELPALLAGVHTKLIALDTPGAPSEAESGKATPAQVRKSITPNALISFLNGQPYKTLKRHLSAYGLDPDAYRKRFGLPLTYPMVAPNYAAQRADLARDVGFGQWRRKTASKAASKTAARAGTGKEARSIPPAR